MVIHPSLRLSLSRFPLSWSLPLVPFGLGHRQRGRSFLISFHPSFQTSLPLSSPLSIRPSFSSFSGTREVLSLRLLTTPLRTKTAAKCAGRSGGTRKRTQRTWTLRPPTATMKTAMKAGRPALAAFGSSVRRRRGSAGTAPGRGSPSGGVACKPVPPATPACKCESRSDGRSTKCPNSPRSVDKDPRPGLETDRNRNNKSTRLTVIIPEKLILTALKTK